MIAALALGASVLPPPAALDIGTLTAAMKMHVALPILLGLVLGWIVSHRGLSRSKEIVAGLALGHGSTSSPLRLDARPQ